MAQNTAVARVGLGNPDLKVYPFGLGGNTFGTRTNQQESERVLDAFVDNGGNLIDTADMYSYWVPGAEGGESEDAIGRWMSDRGNRDQVAIVTKVGGMPSRMGLARENVEAALDESLRRLQTDYVDLYFANYDDESLPVEDYARTFDKLVREGKVRNIGASNLSPERIGEWLRIAEAHDLASPVVLQPNYSLVSRQTYESQYAPLAEAHKLGVITYSSLASGFLSGKYRTAADLEGAPRGGAVEGYLNDDGLRVIEALGDVASAHGAAMSTVALAWLLSQPTVSAPLASATSPEQLAELMAVTSLELSRDEIADLTKASSAFA